MAPRVQTPSTYETQLSIESHLGINGATTATVNTIADASIGDDTPHAGERLCVDGKVDMRNLDGNYSEDMSCDEDEDSGKDGSHGEDGKHEDEADSDENPCNGSSEESLHEDEDELNHEALRKFLEKMTRAVSELEEHRETIKALERRNAVLARLLHAVKARRARDAGTSKRHDREVSQLRRELMSMSNRASDRDIIHEANKQLRRDLDEKEEQLRTELDEKADYHRTKEERTEFHRRLIEKTDGCAELKRTLDVFSAQGVAMFAEV